MSTSCNRTWLLTSTTYGSWLPGDERGFVSPVRDPRTQRSALHNVPGTPCNRSMAGLSAYATEQMQHPAVLLSREQAHVVAAQFRETARYRNWRLLAGAVMANHFHVALTVPGDPDPATLLRDFKSYASRALNRRWKRSANARWWTQSGSRRKKANKAAIRAAVNYVWNQPNWLARHVDASIPSTWLGERPA